MNDIDTVWIGHDYPMRRIMVLGESWYGDYVDNTDAGYVALYLAGKVTDRMYSRMANAVGMSRSEFWNSILFTNYVQRVGDTREDRPTQVAYLEAAERLCLLLATHRPAGVWVLGKEQAEYSAPMIEAAGVACVVSRHPTAYGVPNRELGADWQRLMEMSSSPRSGAASR